MRITSDDRDLLQGAKRQLAALSQQLAWYQKRAKHPKVADFLAGTVQAVAGQVSVLQSVIEAATVRPDAVQPAQAVPGAASESAIDECGHQDLHGLDHLPVRGAAVQR